MAAFENWHLQRGCLKPADASVFDTAATSPACINRHMDPMLGPTGITDLAKEEMFGGGRRTVQRPGGSRRRCRRTASARTYPLFHHPARRGLASGTPSSRTAAGAR